MLAVGYLQNWLGFDRIWFYVICWAIIAVLALMNTIGVKLIAFSSTLFSGPVLYYVFRAIYGGPVTPSREAGDEAIAIAEAEAAEDAD